jgi:hypothetical protein
MKSNVLTLFISYVDRLCWNRCHTTMAKYDMGPSLSNVSSQVTEIGRNSSMDGDRDRELHQSKSYSGAGSNMDGDRVYEFHRIKTESGSNTTIGHFDNPTKSVTKGFPITSSVMYIKSEPRHDAAIQCYPQETLNFAQSESSNTVMDSAGTMYMVSDDTQIPIQMCEEELTQGDDTHMPCTSLGIKYDHIYGEDDTYTSESPLPAAIGDEYTATEDKPHKCDQCEKSFSNKSALVRHTTVVHSGTKPYMCDHCGKSFSKKGNLVVHIRVHTGVKPYKCDQCMKSCSLKGDLVKHIRVHSGDKPYKCEQCMKLFARKDALLEHMRLHTGDKPYKCDQCEKSFSQKKNLVQHIRIHTGD